MIGRWFVRKERQSYILILPSLFTTGNLFCGFYSLVRSFNHDFEKASYAILLAGIFDVLDGRVARMTKSHSQFGVEYDSIADVVSFGIAPSVLAYIWSLQSLGRVGWVAAFFFAACGALRLARFNTIANELPKSYFLGLPIPAAADCVATAILATEALHLQYPPILALAGVLLLGLLMVSSVRYRSFKDFDLRHRRSFFQLVLLVIMIAFIAIQHEIALATVFGCYALWGLLRELLSWLRKIMRKEEVSPSVTSPSAAKNFRGEP
ncbi:MAG: CDP-diacylglycerol--serine O-phosphatidyltransferase [Deltaproteobacteria bacterium]|nr:CDP-diacylglycerol--serine O-phosphatidyltransferase [Deltaproteobacteria bacterium]